MKVRVSLSALSFLFPSTSPHSTSPHPTVAQRKLRLALDPAARHTYICDQHKDMIQVLHLHIHQYTSTGENILEKLLPPG